MKNKILLSTLLLVSVIAIGTSSAFAATSATQTITGTLAAMKKIETNGGTLTSVIDTDTGTLNTAFSPGFKITTNTNAHQNLDLTALCNTTGGNVTAFSDKGAPAGSKYIAITNSGVLPAPADVTNALSAAPTVTSNPNVIAYAVTPPTDTAGQLVFTWQTTTKKYTGDLSHKGDTLTAIGASGGAATNTYSFDDEPGSYLAAITLSFNP